MKVRLSLPTLLIALVFFSGSLFSCQDEGGDITENTTNTSLDSSTTFVLVRHAETTGIGSNPGLSKAGQNRAIELVNVLKDIPLKAVFSTSYKRTTQTASPVAEDQSLTVTNYDPSALREFVDENIPKFKGETILVVGHSNTTPDLLNILVNSNRYSNIPEEEYDNLYTVKVDQNGKVNVLHTKYGP